LVLAEGVKELSCICSKSIKTLKLGVLLIVFLSELDFDVPLNNGEQRVNEFVRFFVVIFIVVRSQD
jgi:hypothetical protein